MPKPRTTPSHCKVCERPMRRTGVSAKEEPNTVVYYGITPDGRASCATCFRRVMTGREKVFLKPLEASNVKIPAKLPDDVLRRNEGLRAYVLDRRRRGIPSVVGWAA